MIVDVLLSRLGRLVQTTEPLSCRIIASEICDMLMRLSCEVLAS